MAADFTSSLDEDKLSARQRNELEYHREHAALHAGRRNEPIPVEIVTLDRRRWWNAFWHLYTITRGRDWRGKRVLIPGCGFGDDAARFAKMGAEVYAFDLSPEIVEIARARCDKFGYANIHFGVMPCEKLDYPDSFFDAVFFCDMLHHVDIPAAVAEARRVLKPGAEIVGMELYTHSAVEKIFRKNPLVTRFFYPRMKRYIYGMDNPYITEDEHKIDDQELDIIRNSMTGVKLTYFYIVVGRLLPTRWNIACKADRIVARALGGVCRWIAGRVLFSGSIVK
jgi:ubiquinone/menaquinone biosynthesis C-methylase UbiE